MRVVLNYIFDWLPFAFGVGILLTAGFTPLADEFKEFKAARICFCLSTAWIYGKVIMWAYFTSEQFQTRAVVTFLVFGLVGVGLVEILRLTHRRETPPESKNALDLKLEIDRVLPLWNYKPFQMPLGVPVPIPQGKPPASKEADTYIAVVGKIINPRDVQASAEYWEISSHLADGRTIKADLLSPPNQMVINHPHDPPEFINGKDYWPRKLDMQTIPAHGNSYGFVFGVLKRVKPQEFDKPGTAVTLCFNDAEGRHYCDTLTRKNDVTPHHPLPPPKAKSESKQSPQPLESLTDSQRYVLNDRLSHFAGKRIRLVRVGNDYLSNVVLERLKNIFSDAGWSVDEIQIGNVGVAGLNFPSTPYLTSRDVNNETIRAVFSIFENTGLDLPLVPDAFEGPDTPVPEIVIVIRYPP